MKGPKHVCEVIFSYSMYSFGSESFIVILDVCQRKKAKGEEEEKDPAHHQDHTDAMDEEGTSVQLKSE